MHAMNRAFFQKYYLHNKNNILPMYFYTFPSLPGWELLLGQVAQS